MKTGQKARDSAPNGGARQSYVLMKHFAGMVSDLINSETCNAMCGEHILSGSTYRLGSAGLPGPCNHVDDKSTMLAWLEGEVWCKQEKRDANEEFLRQYSDKHDAMMAAKTMVNKLAKDCLRNAEEKGRPPSLGWS